MPWTAPQSLSDSFGAFCSITHNCTVAALCLGLTSYHNLTNSGSSICAACPGCSVLNLPSGSLPQGHFPQKPPILLF